MAVVLERNPGIIEAETEYFQIPNQAISLDRIQNELRERLGARLPDALVTRLNLNTQWKETPYGIFYISSENQLHEASTTAIRIAEEVRKIQGDVYRDTYVTLATVDPETHRVISVEWIFPNRRLQDGYINDARISASDNELPLEARTNLLRSNDNLVTEAMIQTASEYHRSNHTKTIVTYDSWPTNEKHAFSFEDSVSLTREGYSVVNTNGQMTVRRDVKDNTSWSITLPANLQRR